MRISALLLAMVSLAVLLTFILLGQYAYPSADDFCMAHGVKQEGLFPHLWQHYLEWSGRYSGNAFYAIYPLIIGLFDGYKYIPVLVILSLLTATAFFLSKLFKIRMNSYLVVLASLCFVTIYLLGMVSTASSLYWMAGALTYQTANILLLLALGLMVQLMDHQKQQKSYSLVFVSLFIVIILGIGTNENNMLILTALLVLGVVVHFKSGWVILKPWFVLLIIGLACFAVVYFSPGTAMRESTFPLRHDLSRAIPGSLDMGLWTLKIWLSNPVLLVASTLTPFVVILLNQLPARSLNVSKSLIVVLIILTFLIPVILQFPAWWSMGGWPPPRTVDAIFFVFLVSWFLTIGAIAIRYMPQNIFTTEKVKTHLYAAIVLLMGTVFFSVAVWNNNKFQRAQHDLFVRAKPFHEYMLERHALINDALQYQQLSLIVPDFKQEYPRSIYFNDILPFSRDWRNVCYANYFGLQRIKRNKQRRKLKQRSGY